MKMNKRVKESRKYNLKVVCVAGVVMIAAFGMTSCGGNNKNNSTNPPSQEQNVKLDCKQVATDILNAGDFNDQLEELDSEMFEVVYPDVDANQVIEKYAYTGTAASAEQIVVVEATDAKAVEGVKEALNLKLQGDIDQNRDYLPNEIPKLEKPVLTSIGNYVILCVSNDNAKVEAVIDALQ